MDNAVTFTISQLANELNIAPSAIRFYEEKGFIHPGRSSGNQRVYLKKDRARLKLILRGRRLGFSLDDIGEMIGLDGTNPDEISQIDCSLKFAALKLNEIKERKHALDTLEQDILNTQAMLIDRLNSLKNKE